MKRETFIYIFCIIIMLGLTVKISLDSAEYDCNKCAVNLLSTIAISGEVYTYSNISILKLIKAYKEGECLFTWDPVQGYMNNGYK